MKSAIVLVSIMGLRLCGSDEAPPATTAAAPPTTVAVAAPQHGGTIVVAGEKSIEVIAKADGTVEAWVPQGAADAQLTVHVRGSDGQPHPVTMQHTAEGHFTGRVEGTVPTPGPVEVVYVQGGSTLRGNAEVVAVMPALAVAVDVSAIPASHGGLVVGVEGQPVEVVAKSGGEIEAFFVPGVDGQLAVQPAQATLVVEVMGSDQQVHPVTLSWDAATSSYKGDLEGELEVVPGPMEVVITHGGRARRARSQLPGLAIGINGNLDNPGRGLGRGRGRGRVAVEANGNTVQVGGGAVRVGAPGRGGVVVGGGAGGGVVVGGGGAGGTVRVGVNAPPPPSARVEVRVQAPQPPPPPRVRVGGGVGVSAGGGVRIGN